MVKIKVDVDKIPVPRLKPTHSVRIDIKPGIGIVPMEAHIVKQIDSPVPKKKKEEPKRKEAPKEKKQRVGKVIPWRKEEDEQIREYYYAGFAYRDFPEIPGRTLQATISRIKKLRNIGYLNDRNNGRNPVVQWSEEEERKLIHLYNDGVSTFGIAQELGRREIQVEGHLSELRKRNVVIKRKRQGDIFKWTKEQDEELKALSEKGLSIEEIAVKIKKTPGIVRYRCGILSIETGE